MKHTVTEHTLPTGTKGLLIDVPGSNVINIKLYFRAGYQFGDFAKYEAPHLIEHHVLNATKAFPKKNLIMAEFSVNGAFNNAFTSPAFIGYVAECAEFEAARIFELLTEVIARPLFPDKYYKTERENVRTELTRYLSDYGRQANVLGAEASYPHLVMNYAKRLAQLDRISHDDVVAHYRATHQALNANFIVSGATHTNEALILGQLSTLFGELPAGKRRELRDDIGLGMKVPIVAAQPIDSVYFNLNWFQGGVTSHERAAGNLLRSVLTGGFGSRIYGKARDEGLTYHIYSSQDTSSRASAFGIGGFCNPAKWDRLLELIAAEASDIATRGPSEVELSAAKRRSVGSITLSSQTAADVSGWYAGDYAFDGSTRSYDDYFRDLKAVTPEEVQRLAERFLSSKRHAATLVGKVSEAESTAVAQRLQGIWQ